MTNDHDIMCPSFANCNPCNLRREEINRDKVLEYFQAFETELAHKHLYLLTVSLRPDRSNYHRFSMETIKKVGRELINGMNSLSGVSNRRFWTLYVDGGIRYFSIKQELDLDFPSFNHHILFYGKKDNLDIKMNAQIKYRLAKISRDLHFGITYLGSIEENKLDEAIDVGVNVYPDSVTIKKLGDGLAEEISKIRDQRPISFGGKRIPTAVLEV